MENYQKAKDYFKDAFNLAKDEAEQELMQKYVVIIDKTMYGPWMLYLKTLEDNLTIELPFEIDTVKLKNAGNDFAMEKLKDLSEPLEIQAHKNTLKRKIDKQRKAILELENLIDEYRKLHESISPSADIFRKIKSPCGKYNSLSIIPRNCEQLLDTYSAFLDMNEEQIKSISEIELNTNKENLNEAERYFKKIAHKLFKALPELYSRGYLSKVGDKIQFHEPITKADLLCMLNFDDFNNWTGLERRVLAPDGNPVKNTKSQNSTVGYTKNITLFSDLFER